MAALTAALIATTVASTYIGFKSQRDAAKSAEKQGQYEKDIYDKNSKYAEEQAADAISRGRVEENRYRSGVKQVLGAQRTGFAGQGVMIGVGSAADVRRDSQLMGEVDALTIRNNAAREAMGFKVEAEDLRQRGVLTLMGAKSTAKSYRNAATGTLLTGAAQVIPQVKGLNSEIAARRARGNR